MANVRTLKLNLLGDVSQFRKSMRTAAGDTDSFSGKVKSSMASLAKSAALAGVAVAGMAVAFGVDAVKAAIEDDKAQKKLQNTLKNTTKATKAQRMAVEDYITKAQFTYGIVDDKLRPAFGRLAVATGSISKSQELLNLAMNVSAGTGKDLESVTNAIAKAYGGNLGALKKLGINVSDVAIKTKNFASAQQDLNKAYSGAALTNAKTFAGRLDILKIRFGEFKESVGYKLIPVLAKAMDIIEKRVIPLLGNVADGFNGKDGVTHGVKNLAEVLAARNIGKSLRDLLDAFGRLFTSFAKNKYETKTKDLAASLQSVADALTSIADTIDTVKPLIDLLAKISKYTPNLLTLMKFIKTIQDSNKRLGINILPKLNLTEPPATPTPTPSTTPRRRSFLGGQAPVTINLNGIVDAESARQSIEKVLQSSSVRTVPVQVQGSLI